MSKFKRAQYDDVDIICLKIDSLEKRLDMVEKLLLNNNTKSDDGFRELIARALRTSEGSNPTKQTLKEAHTETVVEQSGGTVVNNEETVDDLFAMWRRQTMC